MLDVRFLDDTLNDRWDDFVKVNEHGTLFHTNAWLKLCEATQGSKLIRLGFFNGDKLVAIFPFFYKRFFLLKVIASPIVVEDTPYMGPLFKDEQILSEIMIAFERFLKKNRINFTRIIFHARQNQELFENLGYTHIPRHTHILDLSPGEKNIWTNMQGRARTAIRKANKGGVDVYFANGAEYLDKYYALSETLYARQKKIPPNSKEFYSLICTGDIKDHSRMVVASLDGITIAFALIVHYKDTAYYLDAVSDKRYNKYNANSAIQWFIIRWAIDNGFDYYDFVGSDFPWIAKFKASFGGKVFQYSLIEKAKPSWVFSIRQLYGRNLKPFWQRLKATTLA